MKVDLGVEGPPGPPGLAGGGTVYIRWGRTTCPSVPGTERVYEGIAAGSKHNQQLGRWMEVEEATAHCMGQSMSCMEALPCQTCMSTMFLVSSAVSALDLWSTLYQRGITALLVGHWSTVDT